MKVAIVALLVAIAMAGGASRRNRISVIPGNSYHWDFTCGYNYGGAPAAWTADTFTYNFVGLPSWLNCEGPRVWGVPPVGVSGHFPFKVSWSGRESGESWFTLSVLNAAAPASAHWANSWFYCEPVDTYGWRVYLPYYNKITWSVPEVNIPEIKIPEVKIPEVKIPKVHIPKIDVSVGHGIGLGGFGGFGGWNCNNPVNYRGSGLISFVGTDNCVIDGRTVKFVNCTNKRFRKGKKKFHVNDRANFECYFDGNTYWAKTIDCQF